MTALHIIVMALIIGAHSKEDVPIPTRWREEGLRITAVERRSGDRWTCALALAYSA